MFEPLHNILNAGADRPTQHTASLCLLEYITLLHAKGSETLLNIMAPAIVSLILVRVYKFG